VKETKRQGQIAHHHADATVPHIVALLGFSFHTAKIRTFPESSKLSGKYFNFLPPYAFISQTFCNFAHGSGE